MSSNVGLATPRGSGTSGHITSNKALLFKRDLNRSNGGPTDFATHKQREPDAAILEHERKRKIEVKVFELRDHLEEEGVDEDEIDERTEALRNKLMAEEEQRARGVGGREQLKGHQSHEIARAKIEESERVRRAFGIGKDYEEGSHWKKQDEKRKRLEEKAMLEERERLEAEERREQDVQRRDDDTESDFESDDSGYERRRGDEERSRQREKYRDRDGERHEDPHRRSRSPSYD